MGIALREQNEVALVEMDRLAADRMSPARAAGDQVIFDDALGARHHFRGDRARRRRLGDPWRAQIEIEVHRSRQADCAQDVREHVTRQRVPSRAGRAGIRSGRLDKARRLTDERQHESDAGSWFSDRTRRTLGDAPGNDAPAVLERISV